MQTGISTASLFGRFNTEDALSFLSHNNVRTAEVFLESFCEYNREFGELLFKRKGETEVHSIHTLTTQFESTLYSLNERAVKDSFYLLDKTMQAAKAVGAKYYTFHGLARVKRTPYIIDFDRVGAITQRIIDDCLKYGVSLAYENVHWAYYNYIGFFTELKKRTTGLKGTFDIKQARQSNIDYRKFIDEMGADIATAHLSDLDKDGKMCLPGRGITDFKEVLTRLRDKGFDGAILIEAYKNDFNDISELFEALEYLTDLAHIVFNG